MEYKYLFKITGGSYGKITGRAHYYKPHRIITAPAGEFAHLKEGEDYEIVRETTAPILKTKPNLRRRKTDGSTANKNL